MTAKELMIILDQQYDRAKVVELLEEFGKQEYNAGVRDAEKLVYPVTGWSEMDKVHCQRIKNSILKLIKP